MRMSIPAILAIAALNVAAPTAQAQALDPVPLVAVDVAVLPLDADAFPTNAAAPSDSTFGSALDGHALDALRGGTDNRTLITNASDVDGRVDGNTSVGSVTGGNLVDGGAFGHAAGLSTVIQNSGNNVLIQNSTVVSVQFAPTP
jgi:hypothetical protein